MINLTMFVLHRTVRWLLNVVLGLLRRLLLWVIASGPLPHHIAFVMDGNRRYAGKKGKPINEGHYAGYSALYRVSHIPIMLRHLNNLISDARDLLPSACPCCDSVCLCHR